MHVDGHTRFALPTLRTGLLALALLAWPALGCGGDDDGGGGGSSCDEEPVLRYTNFGQAFVSEYCASCHGGTVAGPGRNGAPPSLVFDTLAQLRTYATKLNEQVVVLKTMPFGSASKKPSEAERAEFGRWLRCGAAE